MRKIWIIGILILLLLLPITSAVDIDTERGNDSLKTYRLTRIKTTKTSGGSAFCFPGFLRSIVVGCTLIHSFVFYDDNYWEGWYLTIDGEKVSRGRGYIFGFTGKITNWWLFQFNPDYEAFDLDGFAIFIIHISD
jgi:hypothetical protein